MREPSKTILLLCPPLYIKWKLLSLSSRSLRRYCFIDDDSAATLSLEDRFPKRRAIERKRGWTGVIETLSIEHVGLQSLLDTLEQLTERLKAGSVPDYALMLDVLDYLQQYPDRYHHPREERLFARLAKEGNAWRKLLARMEGDHRQLTEQNRVLFRELTRIVRGGPANRPGLLRQITAYTRAYRKHMQYETEQIFQHAGGSLSDEDWQLIHAGSRYVDDPIFGERVERKYHRLVRNLRTRFEIWRDAEIHCAES